MTRRLGDGREEASAYDGIPDDEIDADFDWDGGEIVRPSQRVIVVTPDGMGEAVSSDRERDEEKQKKRIDRAAKIQEAADKVAALQKKPVAKKTAVKKKTTKPKE
jgi:hypothetical protein